MYVDPDLWERIVLNLVSNAFKVTLEGWIEVGVHERDGWLVLTVADTGPGIPPAELERLFQRFHRVASLQARSNEGTGIGLALVKELAELHGGEVAVESTVGEGSRFTVRLPLGRDHLPADQTIEETDRGDADHRGAVRRGGAGLDRGGDRPRLAPRLRARRGCSSPTTTPDLRRYLVRLLGPLWHVQTVSDGAEALAQIRRDPPDLLVTDVMMPGLDGFELLRELRADARTRELPVIMLSARAGEEAAIEGLEAGADDYLPKPFSGRELVARVRAHLEMAQVRRQAADELRAKSDRLEEALAQLLRSQQLIAAQRDILALIAGGAPLERSLHEIVRWTELIAESGARASVLLLDEDGRRLTHGAAPSLPDAYNAAIDGIAIGPSAGSCGTAAYRRETGHRRGHRHAIRCGTTSGSSPSSTGCGPAGRCRSRPPTAGWWGRSPCTTTTRARRPMRTCEWWSSWPAPPRWRSSAAATRRRARASWPSCRAACCRASCRRSRASAWPPPSSPATGRSRWAVTSTTSSSSSRARGASSSATSAATAPRPPR